jgi:hypothetical protein
LLALPVKESCYPDMNRFYAAFFAFFLTACTPAMEYEWQKTMDELEEYDFSGLWEWSGGKDALPGWKPRNFQE